jgi:hypothetical protein
MIFDFFEFFMLDSKCGQNGGPECPYLWVESWRNFYGSMMKYIVLNLKMIFWKNHEQTMNHL